MIMLMVMAAAAGMLLMMMLMVMTAAAMLVMMLVGFLQLCHFSSQSSLAFHSGNKLFTGQLTPGSGDNGSFFIMLSQQCHRSIQLGLRHGIGTGQNDGGGSLNLVVIELTEVLHIDLHLTAVNHGNSITQGNIIIGNLLDSADDIGQLANTGRLNDNAVGVILLNDLRQGLAEVTHQRAADAAGIHLGNIDTGILQETTVNADLAEFIFNENQFLACIGLLNHFLDKGGLTGTQKTGIDINFHKNTFRFLIFPPYSITPEKYKGKDYFSFSSTAFDCLRQAIQDTLNAGRTTPATIYLPKHPPGSPPGRVLYSQRNPPLMRRVPYVPQI